MEDIMAAFGGISFFVITAWVIRIFVVNRRELRQAEMQVDIQTRLIDKFESPEELRTYLESEGGQRLLRAVPAGKAAPYGRILGSIQAGVILTLGGLVFLLIGNNHPGGGDEQFAMMFLGSLGTAIGLGFVISAAAAYWLSKSWGLINGDG